MSEEFEKKHPRHPPGSPKGGRFAPKSTARQPARRSKRAAKPATPPQPAPADRGSLARVVSVLRDIGDEDLAVAYVRMAAEPDRDGKALALAALDEELARREGVARLTVHDDPHSRQVDELVRRGWSHTDAYADVHGLDPARLAREERAALVDAQRRPGERRADTLRRMYAEHVYVQYLAAEEMTQGNVLSREGRAKGIDPASLWSGQAARARKYASDELKAWWEQNGGRQTSAQFRAQYVGGTEARRAGQGAALAGSGRDYGV